MEMATSACAMANGVVPHVQKNHASSTTTAENMANVQMTEMATSATATANGQVPCAQKSHVSISIIARKEHALSMNIFVLSGKFWGAALNMGQDADDTWIDHATQTRGGV